MRSLPRVLVWRVIACLAALSLVTDFAFARGEAFAGTARAGLPEVAVADLPREAQDTLRLIDRGGPFPYERDGIAFGNFEKLLPVRERGYYREYTVRTPGVKHRGARRIVTGSGGERYYTDDHYRSFRRVRDR